MSFTTIVKNMFMTPGKKKESDDTYYRKMFPLGVEQQTWESNTIEKLFNDNKKIPTYKYVSLIRREMYIDQTTNDENSDSAKAYNKTIKRMKISEEERKLIDALAKLEYRARSIKDLPSINDIRNEANK